MASSNKRMLTLKLKAQKKNPAVVSHAKDLIYFRACVDIHTHSSR